MSLGKNQRQFRIAQILKRESVSSQDHLVELLAAEGVETTQATASRDLDDLGAVKVPTGGGSVYAIPELPSEQVAPEDHLTRVLGEWVVAVGCSANVVVLHTPPGSAHVVGSAIDRSRVDAVLGTVAGDDTVLVIATEAVGGEALAAYLRCLAGLSEPQSDNQISKITQVHENPQTVTQVHEDPQTVTQVHEAHRAVTQTKETP